jgi:hypothetical protein
MRNKILLFASLIVMTNLLSVRGQFHNPKNLEFTWKTDTTQKSVDLSEITLVLPKGSFPKIDFPSFLGKREGLAAFFRHEPVISVEIGGKAKAYPLNMLTVHEISNDKLDGIPILATYCPLCNAGVVFDRRVVLEGKEEVLTFEVSGMLRKSDMVMLDTRTETLWQQFLGEAIVGEHTGTFLEVIPSMIISVEEFFDRYPKGRILSNKTENSQLAASYGNNPYVGYDSKSGQPYERYFDPGAVDPRLPAMERVIDIQVDGQYKIYPFSLIAEEGVINDTFRNVPLVFFHGGQTVSVLDSRMVKYSRAIGSVTVFDPVVDGRRLIFDKTPEGFRDRESGSLWDITGRSLEGPMKGQQLDIVPHSNHFAFAWLAFFPESEIYGQ